MEKKQLQSQSKIAITAIIFLFLGIVAAMIFIILNSGSSNI